MDDIMSKKVNNLLLECNVKTKTYIILSATYTQSGSCVIY